MVNKILRLDRRVVTRSGQRVLLAVVGLSFSASAVFAEQTPPTPGANPQRDIAAIEAARKSKGLLQVPSASSTEEILFYDELDAAIRPVRATAVSVSDAKRLGAIKKAIDKKQFSEAQGLRSEVSEALARKLAQWMLLRAGQGTIQEYRKFLTDNPLWPNRWRLVEHLEEKLLKRDDARLTLATFKTLKPNSGVGLAVLAVAHSKTGDLEKAKKLARLAWRGGDIPKKLRKGVKAKLGSLTDVSTKAFNANANKVDAKWRKVRSRAYDAMKTKNFKKAYNTVGSLKGLSVNPAKDQAFLKGWLALRYLGDAKTAMAHFKTMRKLADGPLSRSKSAYWLGRAYEAAGQKALAQKSYKDAFASQVDTFHAHLARHKVGGSPLDVEIKAPASPTKAQINSFQDLDAAKALVIADKAGLGRSITRPFLANLGKIFRARKDGEAEVALVAHLAKRLGDTQQSLRIAKSAIARGLNMLYYAYPLHAFPDYKPLRKPPETAFLLAIARQESEFNSSIVSHAGARGILQVMPITARHVCRDYKLKCNIGRLLTDESYNTKISSAYIADRMGEFGGSYVLGLAGYNAGPGRARQWIRQFGDPRDGRIDEIDWIERMPFRETRKYVAKVLSNIQMYRARLGEKSPLRLTKDLERAKRKRNVKARHAPGSKWLKLSSGD
ncbi:MAG: lytic transglycosylase domain-containing protein [Filomicrobium sp.]